MKEPPAYGKGVTLVPEVFKIETTDRCNALCIMCSHTFYPKDQLGDMDFKDVTMLIDEVSTWKPKPLVQLDLIGEALVYPRTVDAVRYAHNKGLRTRIYTNAQLLTKEMMASLIDAGLDTFSATIDGITKETYEKIRPGLNFETVRQNILDAWQLCRKSKTQMCVGVVSMEENKHELDKIVRFWSKRCHKYFINPEIGGIDPDGKVKPGRVGPVFPRGLYKGIYSRCLSWAPWTQMDIRVNGCIPMCSKMYRWGCDPCMGNAFTSEKSLLEIYNSDEWNDYRRRVHYGVNRPYQCKLLCHGFGDEKEKIKAMVH